MQKFDKHLVQLLALCVAVAAAVLAVDLFLPLGVAGALPYVALVVLGLWLPWPHAALVLAAIATALTAIGYFLSPPLADPLIALANRGLVVLTLWLVAMLAFLQKRAWQRLREDEARLRVVTDTAIDVIIVIDETGTIRMVNPATEVLFGYSREELIGHNVKMLMPSPDREQHDDYLRNYLDTGEKKIIGLGREVIALHRDGTTFPAQLAVGEAMVEGERLFTGFIHDLTQRKRAESQAEELQAALYRVSRLGELGEMAAAIAHELNQPLSAVANYIEAARETVRVSEMPAVEKVDGLMAKAVAQSQRASDIVRHIRAMAAREEVELVHDDVNAVVEEAAGLALMGATSKGVTAHIELSPNLPLCPMNRTQIQQVVLNLVRNSIDVLIDREVREVAIRTVFRDDGHIEVAVADTGPGLSEEVADRLFKPFVTTKAEGMGIGLSISRRIIDAHDGDLWAEPNDGGGTVFRFTLPCGTGGTTLRQGA